MASSRISVGLLSVHDKAGIVEFSKGLKELGIKIISTGGTARLLGENHISVNKVEDYTGFQELLDGRVKTLHPKIHAGLLYRRNVESDLETIRKFGIESIDLTVVNLYPFEKSVEDGLGESEVRANIDIGGVALIRSAIKNYERVGVIVDPSDYDRVLSELKVSGCTLSRKTRLLLAVKALEYVAAYDTAISYYFTDLARRELAFTGWPASETLTMTFRKIMDLRYGENPHQRSAVYRDPLGACCIADAMQVAGEKELSYTNILDADAGFRILKELSDDCAAVIIKHGNPCGAGRATTLSESCRRALETDPVSAFGGVYCFTRRVDLETAKILADKFVELILAPGYDPEALQLLSAKKNRRILDISNILKGDSRSITSTKSFRKIGGGLLFQDEDEILLDEGKVKLVTKRQPTPDENEALLFAWKIMKFVKSNAIVIASKNQLLGVGAGQMSRVDSCKIALMKVGDAGLDVKGGVMASDAFLPFRDSIDLMGKAGITAVIQPGGSIRDKEVIEAADEFGMAMLFTGIRHFNH